MTEPCEQEDKIKDIQNTNISILKNQELLSSQHLDLVQKLDGFFSRLEVILLADVERRKDIDQLIKDTDHLHKHVRDNSEEIKHINERNARCDGAGIFENFPKMWNWYQGHKDSAIDFKKMWLWYLGELGWRRFVPAAMTMVTALLALYVTFAEVTDNQEFKQHSHDNSQSQMYGNNNPEE